MRSAEHEEGLGDEEKEKTEKEKVEWDNGGKMHGPRTGGVRVRGRCVEVVGLGHPHRLPGLLAHTTRKGAFGHAYFANRGKGARKKEVSCGGATVRGHENEVTHRASEGSGSS